MLNIPEKLLALLGINRSGDGDMAANTVSAKALLRMMKEVKTAATAKPEEKKIAAETKPAPAKTAQRRSVADSDFEEVYGFSKHYSLSFSFRQELELTIHDIKYLDKVKLSSNNFNELRECQREIVRLFAVVVRGWKSLVELQTDWGRNFHNLLEVVADTAARGEFSYRKGSWNYQDAGQKAERWLFSYVFQLCENAVRKAYAHTRLLEPKNPYKSLEMNALIGQILPTVEQLVEQNRAIILPASALLELQLNKSCTGRWKLFFERLCAEFEPAAAAEWVEKIMELHALNKNNDQAKLIFFEASKFMAGQAEQRVWALKLYIYYAYCEPADAPLKKWAAKQRKAILLNAAAEQFFAENIESQLFRQVDKALFFTYIDKEFAPLGQAQARKKIHIDRNAVAETKAAHQETVQLLSEILDEEEAAPLPAVSEISTTPPAAEAHNFKEELGFSAAQAALLERFVAANFELQMADIQAFAQAQGLAPNRLIDSINEVCYELLDDVLIEEAGDSYQANSIYFEQILKS